MVNGDRKENILELVFRGTWVVMINYFIKFWNIFEYIW